MKISDLKYKYPLIYAKAVFYAENSGLPKTDILLDAFSWSNKDEPVQFWAYVHNSLMENAQGLCPDLFESSRKFKLGPIKFKTSTKKIPEYTSDTDLIPSKLIKHGQSSFIENKGEVIGFHNEFYIVRYLDTKNNYVQLGFKENVLEPLIECWSVGYSSDFTEDMFNHFVKWLNSTYGAYKRKDVPLSWHKFNDYSYPYIWIRPDHSQFPYSQDNHPSSCSGISLDELLRKIDYKAPKPMPKRVQEELDESDYYDEEWDEDDYKNEEVQKVGIVIPSLNLIASKPNFTLRRVPTLQLQTKKANFNQVQIIIKPNHVKV